MTYKKLIQALEDRFKSKDIFNRVVIYRRNEILADEPAHLTKDILYIYPGNPRETRAQQTASEEYEYPVNVLYKFGLPNRSLVGKTDDAVVNKQSEVIDAVLFSIVCMDSEPIAENVKKMWFDSVVTNYIPDYPVADLDDLQTTVFRILFELSFVIQPEEIK